MSNPRTTIWLTGLPGAGKSTLAIGLQRRLSDIGQNAYVLDGDQLRGGLNSDLGFDKNDRLENVRRTAYVACLLADAGFLVIAALISPYESSREQARTIHVAMGCRLFEIYVATPIEECRRRDPKGLYTRSKVGEVAALTGVDDPYEAPKNPDFSVNTVGRTSAQSTEELFNYVLSVLT